MEPDLSQRVAAALGELRGLDDDAASRYLQELRRSDPEAARKLDVMLWAQGSEYRERLATVPDGSTPRSPAAAPSPPAGERGPAPADLPTGSVDARATASFAPPDAAAAGDAGDGRATAEQVLGRYQLLRKLGRGAFGEVWQAYDPVLQKHVAVKAPLARRSGRPLPPSAFLQEARKAAVLRHPAIVQVYDVVESGGGWYIVSEFVEGDSLRARLEAGRLPFDLAARVVATVAGALHAAHLAGLVHRDVKPANILLDRAGNAYLTDFGLAVREDEQFAERSKVSGTLAYMPPEQIRGDTHLLDGRADVYALGAVLYELLTGRLPFRADSYDEYLELILRREPRPPRSIDAAVPEELERVCLKCLAKEVKDRYRTAQDLAADLEAWLAGPARPDTSARAAPVPRWVKPAVVGAVVLSVLAGVVAVLGTIGGGRTAPTAPGPAATEPPPGKAPSRKVPTVKELVWPKKDKDDENKWEVLTNPDRLKVYSNSMSLLQFGVTSGDAWELSATVRQVAGVGHVGLFVGHSTDPHTDTATYELVRLLKIGEQMYLHRRVETYRLGDPLSSCRGTTRASAPVVTAAEYTIRLVVRGNRLVEVYLNDRPLPDLVNIPPKGPLAGPFGAHNRNSDGIFSAVRFNNQPVPLLAEANPGPTEKP